MLIYPSIEEIPIIYKNTMQVSEDTSEIIWNFGQLESILTHIQNDDYYPTFIDKLTHLFFSVCQFHCFENGNKRMAIVISADFLLLNGYTFYLDRFFGESENISIHVAAGNISKEFLHRIFESLFTNTLDLDENIKLEYYNAINKKEIAYV